MYQLVEANRTPEASYKKVSENHILEDNFLNGTSSKIAICDCKKCDLKDILYVNEDSIISLYLNKTNIISHGNRNYVITPQTKAIKFHSCLPNCEKCTSNSICKMGPICFCKKEVLETFRPLECAGTGSLKNKITEIKGIGMTNSLVGFTG